MEYAVDESIQLLHAFDFWCKDCGMGRFDGCKLNKARILRLQFASVENERRAIIG